MQWGRRGNLQYYRRIGRRSKTMDGLGEIVFGFKMINKIVHIIIIWIVIVAINSLDLMNMTSIGGFEFGRWCALVITTFV